MALTGHNFNQTITHWPVTETGFGFSFGTPVVMEGRWEDGAQLFRTRDNQETVSRAIVYLPQDVAVNDYLARGDQSAVGDPTLLDDAYPIKQFFKNPDLRNVDYERQVFL